MEYKKSKILKAIRRQCEAGDKLSKARIQTGISRTTLFYWCQRTLIKRYILECERRSDERRDDGVEEGLLRKLINGNASGKEYEFYLTNRKPNHWKKDRSDLIHEGEERGGTNVTVNVYPDRVTVFKDLKHDRTDDPHAGESAASNRVASALQSP